MTYLDGPNVITKVPQRGRQRQKMMPERCDIRRTPPTVADLKMEQGDHEARNVGILWRLEKART